MPFEFFWIWSKFHQTLSDSKDAILSRFFNLLIGSSCPVPSSSVLDKRLEGEQGKPVCISLEIRWRGFNSRRRCNTRSHALSEIPQQVSARSRASATDQPTRLAPNGGYVDGKSRCSQGASRSRVKPPGWRQN